MDYEITFAMDAAISVLIRFVDAAVWCLAAMLGIVRVALEVRPFGTVGSILLIL